MIDAELARERIAGLDQGTLARHRIVAADGLTLSPLAMAATAGSGVWIGEVALNETRRRAPWGATSAAQIDDASLQIAIFDAKMEHLVHPEAGDGETSLCQVHSKSPALKWAALSAAKNLRLLLLF